jgi:hypothetical protein
VVLGRSVRRVGRRRGRRDGLDRWRTSEYSSSVLFAAALSAAGEARRWPCAAAPADFGAVRPGEVPQLRARVVRDRAAAVADVALRFGPEVGDVQAQLLNSCSNGTPPPGNTQHCDIPVPQPVTVYASFGHMHLLGRSVKVELNPDTPHAQTLLDVPAFDFDDQKLQPLSTPVDLQPGDTVRVTCTHDTTLRGQLPQLSKLPPRCVVWGDGASDEMCLALLTATVGGDGSAP